MGRRKALTMAGALAVATVAATAALGANFGLFRLTQADSPFGREHRDHPAVTAPVTVPVHDDGRLDDD